jgi:hypothetical protein
VYRDEQNPAQARAQEQQTPLSCDKSGWNAFIKRSKATSIFKAICTTGLLLFNTPQSSRMHTETAPYAHHTTSPHGHTTDMYSSRPSYCWFANLTNRVTGELAAACASAQGPNQATS